MKYILLVVYISILTQSIFSTHFRGGIISWRSATNEPSAIATERTIYIDQRYTWSRSAANSSCTATTILSFGVIGEASVSVLTCQSTSIVCNSVQYTTSISTYLPCTDFNTALGLSFGHGSTAVNLTVRSSGFVLGYVVGGAWLTLQLGGGGGGWSLMTYINMAPRADTGLINNSPTSDIQPIVYVPAGASTTAIVEIPMYDVEGDTVQCRFALNSHSFNGTTVNECGGVCATVALPSSKQLISNNNTCTLTVQLTSIGYYAVAIQIEDFLENSTTALSSIPVQFLLLSYDASNPTSNCKSPPIILSIPPDYPLSGGTVTVQVTVTYTAMVIAQIGCANDTDTSITNFITTSPPGMLKTNVFTLSSNTYAINLTWTPTIDQFGKMYTFCATAIDSNYYLSNQYCFNLIVGPKTTTTTTTSTTSTSTTSTSTTTSITSTTTTSTTTTSVTTTTTTTTTSTTTTTITTTIKPVDCVPLTLGLGLGFGLPLMLLLSLLALGYLCRCCPRPLRTLLRHRFGRRRDMYCRYCQRSILFDDPRNDNELKCRTPEGTRRYREQYLRNNDDQSVSLAATALSQQENFRPNESVFSPSGLMSRTVTSFLSPSIYSLPTEDVSRTLSPSIMNLQHHGSILVNAYSKQIQPHRAVSNAF